MQKIYEFLNRYHLLLIGILILGLFLRLYDLDEESIWTDEGWSIHFANQPNVWEVVKIMAQDVHPPLYFVILHYWMEIFGDSEFALRLPSVIFGVGSIFVIYKVGKLAFNKEVGLISALLLAVSFFHIIHSQQIRHYGLMALLVLVSMYFYLKLIKGQWSRKNIIFYVIGSLLLLYTHLLSFLFILIQNIYFIIKIVFEKSQRKRFWKWVLIQLIILIFFSPWLILVLFQPHFSNFSWIPLPDLAAVIYTLEHFSGLKLLLYLFSFFVLLAVFHIKVTKNVYKYIKENIKKFKWSNYLTKKLTFLFLLWVLFPIVFAYIFSYIGFPIYVRRGLLAASLGLYLLVSIGISNIKIDKYFKIILIIFILVISLLNINKEYYNKMNFEEWRMAVNYIEKNAEPNDLLIFHSGSTLDINYNYYTQRDDLIKMPFPKDDIEVNENNINQLNEIVTNYDNIWIVLSHTKDKQSLIFKTLSENYNLSSVEDFIGIYIYNYKLKNL